MLVPTVYDLANQGPLRSIFLLIIPTFAQKKKLPHSIYETAVLFYQEKLSFSN